MILVNHLVTVSDAFRYCWLKKKIFSGSCSLTLSSSHAPSICCGKFCTIWDFYCHAYILFLPQVSPPVRQIRPQGNSHMLSWQGTWHIWTVCCQCERPVVPLWALLSVKRINLPSLGHLALITTVCIGKSEFFFMFYQNGYQIAIIPHQETSGVFLLFFFKCSVSQVPDPKIITFFL